MRGFDHACTWKPRGQQDKFVSAADVSAACFGHMVASVWDGSVVAEEQAGCEAEEQAKRAAEEKFKREAEEKAERAARRGTRGASEPRREER